MREEENNIKVSWQLVAQFVSYEFCQYLCEQTEKENDRMESDVLTFLRNMIVERTEKATCNITKQEIVAKFIMEIRTIKKVEKICYIQDLAKTLVKICPDLKEAVEKLLPRLEGLLSILKLNEEAEDRPNILFAIVEAVHDFTKEACKMLPLPDLPQMLEPWLHPDSQGDQSKLKKNKINFDLYKQAVDCLKKEKITPCEAKIIANSLYEDADLEKLFLNFSDTEADFDSQPLSQQVNLFHPSQPSGVSNKSPSSFSESSLHALAGPSHSKTSSNDPKSAKQIENFEQIEMPPFCNSLGFDVDLVERKPVSDSDSSDILTATQRRKKNKELSPQNNPVGDSDSSPILTAAEKSKGKRIQRWDSSSKEKSSAKLNNPKVLDSSNLDMFDLDFENGDPAPVKSISDNMNVCDPTSSSVDVRKRNLQKYLEFSHCTEDLADKDSQSQSTYNSSYRGLTLTQLLEPFPNIQTNDSEGDSSDCDKHADIRFLTPTMYKKDYVPAAGPSKKTLLTDNESVCSFNQTSISSCHDDDPSFVPTIISPPKKKTSRPSPKRRKITKRVKKQQPAKKEDIIIPGQTTLAGFGFSANENKEKPRGTARKRNFKLFDNDIMSENLDESSLFQKKKKNQIKLNNLGSKRSCPECSQKFKNTLQLKKHVFIMHTSDVICD